MLNYRISLQAAIVAMGLFSSNAFSCPACGQTSQYGSYVNGEVVGATADIAQASASLSQGYASLVQATYQNTQDIVGAIQALEAATTTQLIVNTKAETDALESVRKSIIQQNKTGLIAKSNLEAAKNHGATNIHSSLCDTYANQASRTAVTDQAKALLAGHYKKQVEDRKNRDRVLLPDPSLLAVTHLSAENYTAGEARFAMEQAQIISGEKAFPVSPDTVATLISDGANSSPEAISYLSGWLRTSTTSASLAKQVAKRTVGDVVDSGSGDSSAPVSLIGELKVDALNGVSLAVLDEESGAGTLKLLRGISRKIALSNRQKYESIELKVSTLHAVSGQIGYLSEDAISKLKQVTESSKVSTQVKKGGQ